MLSVLNSKTESETSIANGSTSSIYHIDGHPAWGSLASICKVLTISIALDRFSVMSLLRIKRGQVIHTGASVGEDMPLMVNGVKIGLAEFELVGMVLAARITKIE